MSTNLTNSERLSQHNVRLDGIIELAETLPNATSGGGSGGSGGTIETGTLSYTQSLDGPGFYTYAFTASNLTISDKRIIVLAFVQSGTLMPVAIFYKNGTSDVGTSMGTNTVNGYFTDKKSTVFTNAMNCYINNNTIYVQEAAFVQNAPLPLHYIAI